MVSPEARQDVSELVLDERRQAVAVRQPAGVAVALRGGGSGASLGSPRATPRGGAQAPDAAWLLYCGTGTGGASSNIELHVIVTFTDDDGGLGTATATATGS